MKIGFCGVAGSGKDTAATFTGLPKYSFAGVLKDVCSTLFSWDRDALEGDTAESRQWRETVDPWWAEKLDIPKFTPRYALQYLGTDVLRNHFHSDIWILALERKLPESFVISDVRFENEIQILNSLGVHLVEIVKDVPPWYDDAISLTKQEVIDKWGVHPSEFSYLKPLKKSAHSYIVNKSSLEQLETNVKAICEVLSKGVLFSDLHSYSSKGQSVHQNSRG